MQYQSTRGASLGHFSDILLQGLAPDGGLAMPEHIPAIITPETLRDWKTYSYADLAFAVMRHYIDDIPENDLRRILHRSYHETVFHSEDITPLTRLGDSDTYILELSNGPSLAFKDIAMQFLGNAMEYVLETRDQQLNILGATSGDTGSAAEYAMRGKARINVYMLSPHGRMSPFQQAQMYSLQDANIHNIAIEGVFDDCQDIVKAVSADLPFKRRYSIGTVNSINWARLLAQVVYYFAGWMQATQSEAQTVDFTVPSGNFGNICAGHVARMMGLPIRRLIVATNENDVLDEFFRTGLYRVRGSAETFETSSPSMDISKASNFERFVFDLLGRDAAATRALFGQTLAQQGQFDLSRHPRFAAAREQFGFASGKSTHADRLATIRSVHEQYGMLVDTHTADGVKVARQLAQKDTPMIVLETALPIKFAATIREALGRDPDRPAAFNGIENLPRRVRVMPADAQAIKAFIAQQCA